MKSTLSILKFSIIAISILTLIISTATSQPLNKEKFHPEELKADLEFLLTNLVDNHPRLYQHISKENFDHGIDEIRKLILTEQTKEEFYKILEPLVSAVKCSHTGIRLPGSNPGFKPTNREQAIDFFNDTKQDIGFIKVPTFGIMDMNQYMLELDEAFQTLLESRTTTLLVDLRDNDGGHPIFGAQLFSYLTNEDFTWFERNLDVPDFEPLYNVMQANKNCFRGKVYVFVNGGCLSTTGHLISLLKDQTDAIFIGEEPGSTYTCNDMSFQITLPNTGIEANIPRTTFISAVSEETKNTPFTVDYKIVSSSEQQNQVPDLYYEIFFKILKSS